MAHQNYYDILGIPDKADKDRIKSAYRDLALKYHPDRNRDDEKAVERMQQVNEAYAVLSDTRKRSDYDRLLSQYGSADAYTRFRQNYSAEDIYSGTDIQKIFDEMARTFGFRNFQDLSGNFSNGNRNAFEYRRPGIHVKGFVFSGTLNLDKFRFKDHLTGKIGHFLKHLISGPSGSKERIPLHGKDYHDTIRIPADLAVKGGPYAYYHARRKKKLVIKIPPNVRHGQQIRLAGMGEKGSRTQDSGNLYIRVETRPAGTGASLKNKIKKYFPF